MTKYYIVIDGSQQGPFSLEEIQAKKISSSTLVWTEEMDNWTEAKDIEELKIVVKKAPPPIPQPVEKPLKVEAEISKKREKLITPTTEVVVAKETKVNFKMIFYALIIGVISFPIYFAMKDGFEHQNMTTKLNNHLKRYDFRIFYLSEEQKNKLYEDEKKLERESNQLGYRSYDRYGMFSTSNAISYHKRQYKEAASDSITPSLMTAFIASIILIIGRYIAKGAKWVEDTSKKEV